MAGNKLQHHNEPWLDTLDAPFSHAVIDDHYVFMAGLVAADVPGGLEAIGDITAETRVVLEAISRVLADLGTSMARVVRVDVHLTDLEDMDVMNAVYAEYFPDRLFPARTCTESPALAGGSNLEITCIARR